jgi:hypothetical protein
VIAGGFVDFVNHVDARAELVFVVEVGVEGVEASAVVEGEVFVDVPFVLGIDAGGDGFVAGVVGDVGGCIGGLEIGAGERVISAGENLGVGVERFGGVVADETESKGVAVIENQGVVDLLVKELLRTSPPVP